MDEETKHRCPVKMVVAAVVLVALRVKPQELERAAKAMMVVPRVLVLTHIAVLVVVVQHKRAQTAMPVRARAVMVTPSAMAIRMPEVVEVVQHRAAVLHLEARVVAEMAAAVPQRPEAMAEPIASVAKPLELAVVAVALDAQEAEQRQQRAEQVQRVLSSFVIRVHRVIRHLRARWQQLQAVDSRLTIASIAGHSRHESGTN